MTLITGSQSLAKRDVADTASIKAANSEAEERLNGRGLNLLINNAGIAFFHTLYTVTAEDMMAVYKTNTVGPVLLTQAFTPLLKKAAKENPNEKMSCSKAAVINISSGAGSIERVPLEYSANALFEYRCSKAALNMITCCVAETFKTDGITAVAIAPGWVQTDMGGPEAPLKTEESVGTMMKVFDTLTEKHNGMFLNRKGQAMPW
ncbi:C-signal-like isoform X2 [Hyperolius riggenbachi]|uniref:C-signal-like isoform X2 n=1 Tax=Hyperolius riggenbachi TaxID=752182 RepID=UPI0035A2FD4F